MDNVRRLRCGKNVFPRPSKALAMLTALLSLALTAWPADNPLLLHTELPAPSRARRLRVAIDPGHGAVGNHGNTGCQGQLEETHTLAAAQHLAFVLSALGRFEVLLLRTPGEAPRYQDRIARAEAWKADVILSLHSDSRGDGPTGARNPDAPGFAILWSDRGPPPVTAARERLAGLLGTSLRSANFVPYSGDDYGALYRRDPLEPSAWVDLRPLAQSVYFLRASTIPTVILETHHANDPLEVERWQELRTLDALAFCVAQALLEFQAMARTVLDPHP